MEPLFTPEQLEQLRAYRDPQYFWSLIALPLNLVLLGLVVRFSGPLHSACERVAAGLERRLGSAREVPVLRALPAALGKLWGGSGWGAALLFVFVTFGVGLVWNLPLDVHLDFLHEREFGMTNQSFGRFAWHWILGTLIGASATAFVALGLFGLARRLRTWWWVLGVVCGLALSVSAALDPYRTRIFTGQSPLEEGALRERIVGVLQKAEVEFEDIFVEKTSKETRRVQAYFAGKGVTRRIVLSDTLLEAFTEQEILAVIAHEAAHVRESKALNYLGAALGLLAFLFLIHRLFLANVNRSWFAGAQYGDVRLFPAVLLCFSVLSGVVEPASNAFSRARELEADRFALELQDDAAAFRSMLTKAARINRMDPDPPWWLVLKSYSHPPVRERLAAVDAWVREQRGSTPR